MIIPLPGPTSVDVYSFGFSKNLLRNSPTNSPLVYNQVEERLSQLTPSNNIVSTSVQGLPISESYSNV